MALDISSFRLLVPWQHQDDNKDAPRPFLIPELRDHLLAYPLRALDKLDGIQASHPDPTQQVSGAEARKAPSFGGLTEPAGREI